MNPSFSISNFCLKYTNMLSFLKCFKFFRKFSHRVPTLFHVHFSKTFPGLFKVKIKIFQDINLWTKIIQGDSNRLEKYSISTWYVFLKNFQDIFIFFIFFFFQDISWPENIFSRSSGFPGCVGTLSQNLSNSFNLLSIYN